MTKEGEFITYLEYDSYYPRPQMKRDSFYSLNGKWEFVAGELKTEINVPFPPESILSGVNRSFEDGTCLVYTKSFTLPEGFLKDKVLLHFGAIDQIAKVYVNDTLACEHVGGYDSFSADITALIKEENVIRVEVWDELDLHVLPYGKQKRKRGGMWYTPISGIWQSVWLESVPSTYIRSIKIDADLNGATIRFDGISDGEITVEAPDGTINAPIKDGVSKIALDAPRLWSPSDPYLYRFTAISGEDKIESYFACRTLEIKTIDTYPRICLNGEPYFFHAVLDQGYFSDGIYTPATPELYEKDVLKMKELGFNTLRKHIKIEPEAFYYACDKHGMIVFQDMVNNGKYSFFRDTALPTIGLKRLSDRWQKRTQDEKNAFETSMKKTVSQLYSHPSICYWTIFNEGWGQFESDRMYETLLSLDSTRIIDTNSGWFGKNKSHVESLHVYFKRVKLKKSTLPIVLSEFGGYSYKEKGHVANEIKTYGYKLFDSREQFEKSFFDLYERDVIPNIKRGLCGSVYTQLSDVEDETNGILSYDRKITKLDKQKMLDLASKLKI